MNKNKTTTSFSARIEEKLKQKLEAQDHEKPSLWQGLSLFGLVGWSIVLPTLLGTGLGVWIDHQYRSQYSWTLMLLLGGLMLGCMTAWHWVENERRDIHRSKKNEGEKK